MILEEFILFWVKIKLLLLHYWYRCFGWVRLRSLCSLVTLYLKLFQLTNCIVMKTKAVPIAYVDIGPTSSISNCDSSRPNQITETCNSINNWCSLLLSNLIYWHSLASNRNTPISCKSKCFTRFIIIDAFKPLENRILLS